MSEANVDYSEVSILVIDDQAFVRQVITGVLRHMGVKEVFQADDGASGLKAIGHHKPDLVICDIEMEPVDGLQFLKILRNADDVPNPDVPVIFLTQHAESDTVAQAREAGVTSFIVKPPSAATLKSRIDFALTQTG